MTSPGPARIAIAQPTFAPGGGTEAVTAWTIEALKEDYDVTLISFSPINVGQLNRFCGTSLREGEFSILHLSLPFMLNRTRRFSILKDHLIMRYCKAAQDQFDLFICPSGVMDFGSPGIQYVGLGPGSTLLKVMDRDGKGANWYLSWKRWFMRGCQWLSDFSEDSTRANVTFAPSVWAGEIIERAFVIQDYRVVYPPIDAAPYNALWNSRTNGFLCVSRIIPEKRIEVVIEILGRVRENGHDVSLRIVGRQDDPDYARKIRRLCLEHQSWVSLDPVLDRSQILPLMAQYKYGIHGALNEPFGIAIAEMVKMGCVMFVPNGGGQVEIVGSPQLTFDDVDEAVSNICQVLSSNELQLSVRAHLEAQGKLFSSQAYCQATRSAVDELLEDVGHRSSSQDLISTEDDEVSSVAKSKMRGRA